MFAPKQTQVEGLKLNFQRAANGSEQLKKLSLHNDSLKEQNQMMEVQLNQLLDLQQKAGQEELAKVESHRQILALESAKRQKAKELSQTLQEQVYELKRNNGELGLQNSSMTDDQKQMECTIKELQQKVIELSQQGVNTTTRIAEYEVEHRCISSTRLSIVLCATAPGPTERISV